MSYEAHESNCRSSGVDCERGCNCYNEDGTRCNRYEHRWSTCLRCGESYDVEIGCLACEVTTDMVENADPAPGANPGPVTQEVILVTVIHKSLTTQIGSIARVKFAGPQDNLEARFHNASRAFARTRQGRAYIESTHGNFNWGDALTEIPEEILKAWGILEVELQTQRALVFEHDRRLII